MRFRETVDLSEFADLVVVYLGMRANSWRGLGTVLAFGPRIRKAVDAKPDGLLLHENLFYGLFPLHVGMRQYWRDLAALEKWTRVAGGAPVGLQRFAPRIAAHGPMSTARMRARPAEASGQPVQDELYPQG